MVLLLLLQDVRDNKVEAASAAPQALRLCQMVGMAVTASVQKSQHNTFSAIKLVTDLASLLVALHHPRQPIPHNRVHATVQLWQSVHAYKTLWGREPKRCGMFVTLAKSGKVTGNFAHTASM